MSTRSVTPPPAPPSDVARLRVALWKIAGHIGIDLDSSMGDHQIAELIEHRLSKQNPDWNGVRVTVGGEIIGGVVAVNYKEHDGKSET